MVSRAYLTLALAIAAEVTGTTALKLSDGFTNLRPSFVVVAGYVAPLYFLGLALEELPVSLVYATWAAVGIVATVCVEVVVFDGSLDLAGVAGVGLLLAGVVVSNVVSDAYTPAH
ncbi:QacE family quaternary ammonium compound efflux SMR transporter [Halobacteriales archaeon SW_7_68_16]|nr:MAG: QacE family quaternary ammonium compound efflux SMR transporter [Halobacteriales archaeon SW_7_68_16]